MWTEFEEHFVSLLRPLFPSHADIRRTQPDGEICILVDWKLAGVPDRPNKRSRKLAIHICQETLEDYSAASSPHRLSADERLVRHVSQLLSAFNPEHDAQYGMPEPCEEWVIQSSVVNV